MLRLSALTVTPYC